MKAKITRYATRVTLFTAVLLATCVLAGTANAQAGFQGKFTLPYTTQWGKAVLPAGDYLLKFDTRMPNMLVILNAKSLRHVAFEPISIRQDSGTGKSALLIGTRGERRIVHTLRIAELGEAFVYDPALAHASAVEEARQAQTVPVLLAEK